LAQVVCSEGAEQARNSPNASSCSAGEMTRRNLRLVAAELPRNGVRSLGRFDIAP